MASTACFLRPHGLPTPTKSSAFHLHVSNIKPTQLVCGAQEQTVQEDDGSVVCRRLALTVLNGAAVIGSNVSPTDAAYGDADQHRLLALHWRGFQAVHTLKMETQQRGIIPR